MKLFYLFDLFQTQNLVVHKDTVIVSKNGNLNSIQPKNKNEIPIQPSSLLNYIINNFGKIHIKLNYFFMFYMYTK